MRGSQPEDRGPGRTPLGRTSVVRVGGGDSEAAARSPASPPPSLTGGQAG